MKRLFSDCGTAEHLLSIIKLLNKLHRHASDTAVHIHTAFREKNTIDAIITRFTHVTYEMILSKNLCMAGVHFLSG